MTTNKLGALSDRNKESGRFSAAFCCFFCKLLFAFLFAEELFEEALLLSRVVFAKGF